MKPDMQLSPETVERVVLWAKGQMTWAQVEGFTAKQASEYQKTACELAQRGQLKKAALIFEGLVAINPEDHASRAALGTVYQKMGRIEEALAEYDQAIATSPTDVVALANRGELRVQKGDLGGLDDLRRAVEADPQLATASAKRAKAIGTAIVAKAAEAGARRPTA